MPPGPDEESRYAARPSAELQSPGRHQPEAGDLAHDSGKPAMSQSLLHRGKDLGIAPGLAVDDAVGMQARPSESWGEQVPPAQAPQDGFGPKPGKDAGDEQGGDRGMLRGGRAGLAHLVQRPELQAAVGQVRVDLRHAEGERAEALTLAERQGVDPGAQVRHNEIAPGMDHALLGPSRAGLCS
jgi:hypothetical protein